MKLSKTYGRSQRWASRDPTCAQQASHEADAQGQLGGICSFFSLSRLAD